MKTGRGRLYTLPVDPATYGRFADLTARLDEHSARVLDLVADLPAEIANAVPEGGENSIHRLCLHMAWVERYWFARTVSDQAPLEILPESPTFALPPDMATRNWADIARALHDDRIAYTKPVIAAVASGTAEYTGLPQFPDFSGLLDHLVWHWIYHGGQVGLLRRLLGERYKWTFADKP